MGFVLVRGSPIQHAINDLRFDGFKDVTETPEAVSIRRINSMAASANYLSQSNQINRHKLHEA